MPTTKLWFKIRNGVYYHKYASTNLTHKTMKAGCGGVFDDVVEQCEWTDTPPAGEACTYCEAIE